MNALLSQLNSINKEVEISLKAKKQKQEDIKNIAWKTHIKGYISAFDYVRICNKNEQLSF